MPLPPGFLGKLSTSDADALLAHEFAHMARRDFAKNLLYGFLALPAAYHPVLWFTRVRVAESRELVCDAMAADAVGGREIFAKSLLRLARMLSDRKAPQILHAIGILDANIFERRVMQLTQKNHEIRGARRFAVAAACAVVAIATCTSALALRMDVKAPASDSKAPAKIKVKVTDLTILHKVVPVYPEDAKKENGDKTNGEHDGWIPALGPPRGDVIEQKWQKQEADDPELPILFECSSFHPFFV